jgi:hypothetical protein
MKKYNINHISIIPWNNNRLSAYVNDDYDNTMVGFRGDRIKLTFNELDFMSRPTIKQPFVPTVQKLSAGIVDYC